MYSKNKFTLYFAFVLLFILFSNYSFAQLNTPRANINVANKVPYDHLERIAVAEAQQMWGQVALGQSIPCCDSNGDIVVYMFPFHIGSSTFPGYDEILEKIQEGRAEYDELNKQLLEEVNDELLNNPRDFDHFLPTNDKNDIDRLTKKGLPELVVNEMLITNANKILSARTMTKHKKYGINEFGTIYVSAKFDRFPIPLRSHYLCPYYSMGDLALERAKEALGTSNVILERYYFLTLGRLQYFEFISDKDTVLIDAYQLHSKSPDTIFKIANDNIKSSLQVMSKVHNSWDQVFTKATLQTHTVDLPDLVPDIDWCRGCSPTSASMVIGYWDNYVNGGTYLGCGRLIDYWRDLREFSDGTGWLINVPNILEELRIEMQTDVNGVTNTDNISPGIESVCNTINSYNFNSNVHRNEGDWNWGVIVNEIDNSRPFLWSLGYYDTNGDPHGHSLCAWGYTSDKFVITYSTWGRGRDDWFYNQYDNSFDIYRSGVHTVEPGGYDNSHAMVISSPDGGELLGMNQVHQIIWYQWENLIDYVDLNYSTNGGATWSNIASNISSTSGWNSYDWTVPITSTSVGRVRIRAMDNGSNYIAGDGSFENFTIGDVTPPSAPGIPTDEGVFKTSLDVTFEWTPAVDNETGISSYHLQVGTSPGAADVFDSWIGNVLTRTVTGANGQTLFARVRARNGAGLIGNWSGSSDGITIDITPPSAPGIPADEGAYTISRDVAFNWASATDDESGVVDYRLQVGTSPGDNDLFDDWIGNILTKTVTGEAGQTLYARVQAKNGAGLIGDFSGSSDGITIQSVDVLFCFNLGNSMVDKIPEMKIAATSIMNGLEALRSDVTFGVASFVDYTGSYNTCTYSNQYGDEALGDYPWKANQLFSSELSVSQNTINALQTYFGGDSPQCYSRAMLECMFLDWRPEARKFVLMIGDSPAHDCDVFSASYGCDPGPDAEFNTCDDLYYEEVVNWVNLAGITIISIDRSSGIGLTPDYDGDCWKNFEYMATETGGIHFKSDEWNALVQAFADLGADGPKPVAAYPWIVEAEQMQNCNPLYGNEIENGWRITHQDQPIRDRIIFLTENVYNIKMRAKAEIDGGTYPWLKVQIGDQFHGTCQIKNHEWENISFSASLPAGLHCLTFTYLNDYWVENIGDRNLLLDKVIAEYQDPTELTDNIHVFEAEEMRAQHPQNLQEGDFIKLTRPYAFVGQDIYVERDELTFNIHAKADFEDGNWPSLILVMDGIPLTYFEIESSDTAVYQTTISDITRGKHRVKIAYDNASWSFNRNLYIDKLIIPIPGGGLLKPEHIENPEEEQGSNIPETFALQQNYPNPFNPGTEIHYQIPERVYVVLSVYNIRGQLINRLVNEQKDAGVYQVNWNSKNAAGGIYFYKFVALNDESEMYTYTRKMMLLK